MYTNRTILFNSTCHGKNQLQLPDQDKNIFHDFDLLSQMNSKINKSDMNKGPPSNVQ